MLSNIELIRSAESNILGELLSFMNLPTYYPEGNIFVDTSNGDNPSSASRLTLPMYSQILFLVFFPTVALTARINLKMRAKFLLFGVLCFLAFIVTEFLTIATIITLGLNRLDVSFAQSSLFLTTLTASLMIELSLFFNLTLPPKSRIRPIIKRSFRKQYSYLIVTMGISTTIIYFLLTYVKFFQSDSPIASLMVLHFNIATVMTLAYIVSYPIYKIDKPNSSTSSNKPDKPRILQDISYLPPISFLVPANNEEENIKRCIESIDSAASNYRGKTEIVIVNDGSTDKTHEIVTEVIKRLKFSKGILYDIRNTGKGFALKYGVSRTSGDIIFRLDADSVIDKNAIGPMIGHFRDATVGCVSGMLWELEGRSVWQRSMNLSFVSFMYIIRRAQELFDSILIQSGAYSVFRKDALIKVGGWAGNMLGEDSEITNRIGRFGYKLEFEPSSIVYTTMPRSLIGLVNQRARWFLAYYYARGSNLNIVRNLHEYRQPRSIVFLVAMLTHGIAFAHSLMLPYMIAAIMSGTLNISLLQVPFYLGIFAFLQLIFYGCELAWIAYYLSKVKRLNYIRYFPVVRFVSFVVKLIVRVQVMEVALSWSSKWSQYSSESFEDLRKEVKKALDPNF
jgi:biofilm PGA synthesis N-glycosyltransferase PgaC